MLIDTTIMMYRLVQSIEAWFYSSDSADLDGTHVPSEKIDVLCNHLADPQNSPFLKGDYTALFKEYPCLALSMIDEFDATAALSDSIRIVLEQAYDALIKDRLRWRLKKREELQTIDDIPAENDPHNEAFCGKGRSSKVYIAEWIRRCWDTFWMFRGRKKIRNNAEFNASLANGVDVCLDMNRCNSQLEKLVASALINGSERQETIKKIWETVFVNYESISGNKKKSEWLERVARMHIFDVYATNQKKFEKHYAHFLDCYPELACTKGNITRDVLCKLRQKYASTIEVHASDLGIDCRDGSFCDYCWEEILCRLPSYTYIGKTFRTFFLQIIDFCFLCVRYEVAIKEFINNTLCKNGAQGTSATIESIYRKIRDDVWGCRIPSAVSEENRLQWIIERFVVWNIREEVDPDCTKKSSSLYQEYPVLLTVPFAKGCDWACKPFVNNLFKPLYEKIITHHHFDDNKDNPVANVYLRVKKHIAGFDYRKGTFKTWMETIITNVVKDMCDSLSLKRKTYDDVVNYSCDDFKNQSMETSVEQLLIEKECYLKIIEIAASVSNPPNEFISWGYTCFCGINASEFCLSYSLCGLSYLLCEFEKQYGQLYRLGTYSNLLAPVAKRLKVPFDKAAGLLGNYYRRLQNKILPETVLEQVVYEMFFLSSEQRGREREFNEFSNKFRHTLRSYFGNSGDTLRRQLSGE